MIFECTPVGGQLGPPAILPVKLAVLRERSKTRVRIVVFTDTPRCAFSYIH